MKKWIAILVTLAVLIAGFGAFSLAENVLRGDVNKDGAVGADDARLALRRSVDLETYEPGSDEFVAADYDCDGSVSAMDARYILRASVGIVDNIPGVEPTTEEPTSEEPSSEEPSSEEPSSEEPTSEEPSSEEPTTGEPTSEEPVTEDPTAGIPRPTKNNQYDILRSGVYHVKATTTDISGSAPIELAQTDKTTYMHTAAEGMDLAILMKKNLLGGQTIYLMSIKDKAYITLSKSVLDMIGLSEDMFDTEEFSFTSLKPLSDATEVTKGTFNDTECLAYKIMGENGDYTVVYMYGDRLLGFENYDARGRLDNTTSFELISSDVPSDKKDVPKGYRLLGLIGFMNLFANMA